MPATALRTQLGSEPYGILRHSNTYCQRSISWGLEFAGVLDSHRIVVAYDLLELGNYTVLVDL